MAKLEELRDGEEKARRLIDNAEKEAQKIRLGTPEMLEKMDSELDVSLSKKMRKFQSEVEARISTLEKGLRSESESRLAKLQTYREVLEREATAMLHKIILEKG